MSYIFEALKKLEQKRQREGTSRLLMVTGEVTPEHKRRPFWPFSVLAALLLLNAAVMIWWVHSRAPEKQPASAQPPAVLREGASVAPAVTPREAQQQDRPSDTKEASELKAAGASPAPVPVKEAPRAFPTEQTPATRQAKPESRVRPEGGAAPNGRLLDLKELPPAIKSSLPELRISAHFYTVEPQSRFTRINELNLKEGQVLTSGLKLEEITPDGVVLSYQGYRFQMGINESH